MQTESPDVAAINLALEQFLIALRANDLDGIVESYTTHAVVMPPGHRALEGSDAIRRWFRGMLDSFTIEGFESFPEEVVVAGDWAFRRGTFDWRLRARDSGELLEPSSKFLQIWQRLEDGSWRVARGIWNSNQAG